MMTPLFRVVCRSGPESCDYHQFTAHHKIKQRHTVMKSVFYALRTQQDTFHNYHTIVTPL
jgi:hypothetical protein